jgi:hypothetical protein
VDGQSGGRENIDVAAIDDVFEGVDLLLGHRRTSP